MITDERFAKSDPEGMVLIGIYVRRNPPLLNSSSGPDKQNCDRT